LDSFGFFREDTKSCRTPTQFSGKFWHNIPTIHNTVACISRSVVDPRAFLALNKHPSCLLPLYKRAVNNANLTKIPFPLFQIKHCSIICRRPPASGEGFAPGPYWDFCPPDSLTNPLLKSLICPKNKLASFKSHEDPSKNYQKILLTDIENGRMNKTSSVGC